MTHIVLPRMLERGRGVVINVTSSLAQAPPTPLMAAYTSSMAYVHTLSTTLQEECKKKGVTVLVRAGTRHLFTVSIVQTLQPRTLGSKDRSSLILPSHEDYVRRALQTLGRSSCSCGYWVHGLVVSCHG